MRPLVIKLLKLTSCTFSIVYAGVVDCFIIIVCIIVIEYWECLPKNMYMLL